MDDVEWWVGRVGAVAALVPLGAVLWGLWRGSRRPKGRATGLARSVLRVPVYLLIGVLYFGFCLVIWRPLPLVLSLPARMVALVLGTLLYFPGLALVVWCRLTLGKLYNVSSGLGAQLYANHRLVTHGPFAFVRHPMYLGLLVAALGGLLIYRMWTLVFLVVNFLCLFFRARREEQILAIEFGEKWEAYCQRVPGWLPRLWR